MDKAKASGATALNVLTVPRFSFNRRIVIEQAAVQVLPATHPDRGRPRLNLIYRHAARLVVKVRRDDKRKTCRSNSQRTSSSKLILQQPKL